MRDTRVQMRWISLSGLVLWLAFAASGCHATRLPNASEIDPDTLPRVASDGWVRAFDDGGGAATEILTFEVADPTAIDGPRRMTRILVGSGREVLLEVAVIAPDAEGTGLEISTAERWSLVQEPTLPPIERQGATHVPISPRGLDPITIEMAGSGIAVTLEGVTRDYSALGALYRHARDGLGLDTQAGADLLGAIVGLSFTTAQALVLGYGSSGLTAYLDSPTSFGALQAGDGVPGVVTVELSGVLEPVMDLSFSSFRNLPGVRVEDGLTLVFAASGDGTMAGTVTFGIFDPAASGVAATTGTLDFSGVVIESAYPTTGTATLTTPSGSFAIPAEVFLAPDLTPYLPVP